MKEGRWARNKSNDGRGKRPQINVFLFPSFLVWFKARSCSLKKKYIFFYTSIATTITVKICFPVSLLTKPWYHVWFNVPRIRQLPLLQKRTPCLLDWLLFFSQVIHKQTSTPSIHHTCTDWYPQREHVIYTGSQQKQQKRHGTAWKNKMYGTDVLRSRFVVLSAIIQLALSQINGAQQWDTGRKRSRPVYSFPCLVVALNLSAQNVPTRWNLNPWHFHV